MATQRKSSHLQSEKPILEMKAKGPGVRDGHIPVPELIKICQEAQRAINRQAEALEGGKTLHPGPVSDMLKQECTLELIGIKRGSTRLQFGLAKPQAPLPFPDQLTFGARVIGELIGAIKGLANGKGISVEVDPGVLTALYTLASVAQNKRISEIEWVAPAIGERKRITAAVNERIRERIAARLSRPTKAITQIDGILDMADFKTDALKCRIDPAIGAPVLCSFDERDAAKIHLLLRKPVRVVGEATIAPYSDRVESLHIQSIERVPSLSLGEGNFFANLSLSELATIQKVKPTKRVSMLSGGFPDDEDIDEFVEEIYSARR
jgi:hypothetical protein